MTILPYAIGGIAAVMVMGALAAPIDSRIASWTQPGQRADAPAIAVHRAGKGDRMAAARVGTIPNPASAKVDPATGTTSVAKSLELRQFFAPGTVLTRTTTFRKDAPPPPPPVTVQKRPLGCDPIVSPLTTPALAHVIGRCLTENAAPKSA